nr:uncharacterized mitochondrial protein AtMg00810-like [Tanacetum cinerariifolium]
MSSIGELTFFLGLQVKQKQDGIFISQDKYVAKILRKFGLTDGKSASTPIDTEKPLLKDPDGEDMDVHTYRSMIVSLMYLTLSRPNIMFAVCTCARFQVTLKASHLHAIKRIFRYLKGKPHLGLWYPKELPFNLVAYSDSGYAGASLDRKSTTGGCQFLDCRLISWQCKKQTVVANSSTKAEYEAVASCCAQVLWIQNYNKALAIPGQTPTGKENSNPLMADSLPKTILLTFIVRICINMTNDVVRLQALKDRKKVIIIEDSIRQALRLDDADSVDCLPNEEIFAELARIGYEKPSTKLTFYNAFFSAQWKFLIHTILQCMSAKTTAWNEFSSSMASAVICLATSRNLIFQKTCATLTKQVANLEQDKIAQAIEIIKLKQRVKRLEKRRQSKSSGLKRLRKVGTAQRVESSADTVMDNQEDASKHRGGGIAELDADDDVTLEEVDAKITNDADASALRRRRGVIIQDPEEAATASESVQSEVKSKDKGKRILVKEPKSLKRQAQIEHDEAFAKELEAEINANINWNEVAEQKATKKQKINEETEELKTHLQIVHNDKDDVYTEATPLALKVPVVDYQIHHEQNKPFYMIIRADGTHQLFLSFITLLRNFDREDLEMLWKLPNVEASIWRDQRGRYGLAKVKNWKLFESCGVHIITFITTQMILLVERKYPLTRFTLEQMLNNVRLEVKEESEMSLELLRLMRRQQQEGYKPE